MSTGITHKTSIYSNTYEYSSRVHESVKCSDTTMSGVQQKAFTQHLGLAEEAVVVACLTGPL